MSIADRLSIIAENQVEVYNAGYEKGKSEGGNTEEAYNQGFEAGQKSQSELFWGGIQKNGTRVDYNSSFKSTIWDENSFKPLYDIKPTSASYMFTQSTYNGKQLEMEQVEKDNNMVFDFSACTKMEMAFACELFRTFNVIDLTSSSQNDYIFYDGYSSSKGRKVRIERLICSETTKFGSSSFRHCNKLEYIGFEGVLANNLTIDECIRLSHESIMKLLGILKDYAGTGTTHTLTLGTTNLAKLTDAEKAIATNRGWTLA